MNKLNWLLSLKKCKKAKLSWIVLGSCLVFLGLGSVSQAAERVISQNLRSDIKNRSGASFEGLVRGWESVYGSTAFGPLVEIASDKTLSDSDRYIALMSAAKLGGAQGAATIQSFLKDRSWMIRSGALRALAALDSPETADATLPLLRDPALVVRAEAVETVKVLKPKGAVQALVGALKDEANYQGGMAQWVPQKALRALIDLRAKSAAQEVGSLIQSPLAQKDLEFKKQASQTLEILQKRTHLSK